MEVRCLPQLLPPLFLRHYLSLTLELVDSASLASHVTPETPCLRPSIPLLPDSALGNFALSVRVQTPPAYLAVALSAKPRLQFQTLY